MKDMQMINEIGLVYNQIRVNKPDLLFASLLLEEYAGEESELTSISDYICSSIILEKSKPKLSRKLNQIAEEEIRHFRLLGKLITLLGGKLEINISQPVIEINEEPKKRDFRDLIKYHIGKESAAEDRYDRYASETKDRDVSKILYYLSRCEARHIKILADML